MRYLGIDYGLTSIGLAMGDEDTNLALPFDTVRETNLERQLASIVQLVKDEDIDAVVVGYPLTMAGGESAQAEQTLSFLSELAARTSIPVHREDERLTSAFARRLMQDHEGLSHDEHAVAAATILQTYLDRKKTMQT
jgi:putative Holliday junction resolvase